MLPAHTGSVPVPDNGIERPKLRGKTYVPYKDMRYYWLHPYLMPTVAYNGPTMDDQPPDVSRDREAAVADALVAALEQEGVLDLTADERLRIARAVLAADAACCTALIARYPIFTQAGDAP